MVNLGNLYETFLLGDAWLEFEGYHFVLSMPHTVETVPQINQIQTRDQYH